MTILIGKHEFEGPYHNVSKLEEKPGLYAVLHQDDEDYQLIQLSQAENIRECIELTRPYYGSDSTLLAACYLSQYSTSERLSIVEETLLEFGDDDNENCKTEQLSKSAS